MGEYLVGVDVGTGSARAALVAKDGRVVRVASYPTQTWSQTAPVHSKTSLYARTTLTLEQSTDDIWNACCKAVKDVIQDVNPNQVKGIGFDATCSLAVIDCKGKPVTVSLSGDDTRNVILWMDHRASGEAEWINSMHNEVLRYVGGTISPEMQTPKLVWLKTYLKEQCWDRAAHFMDLPDFLTWRATDSLTRSLCSLVCKWTYRADGSPDGVEGWSYDYFDEIGLEDITENNWSKIGNEVLTPGSACGDGLTVRAAEELGLLPGTAVATSIIDAHAGGLGLLGCDAEGVSTDFASRLALICGTSTCHMAVEEVPYFVPGVWGPYWSAMVPGMFLSEAGQSATGGLIDHIINLHPATSAVRAALPEHMHIQSYLNDVLEKMAKNRRVSNVAKLTSKLHVWPDFHGNRSPIADPSLKGMISGLTLGTDEESLAAVYLATIQSLAYGTRHIIEAMCRCGLRKLKSVLICGGLSRNRIFVQTHADVVGLPVLCAREPESVLLGAAMLGACAAGVYSSVEGAMRAMGGPADKILPDAALAASRYHDKKYAVFKKMLDDQREYDLIMSS